MALIDEIHEHSELIFLLSGNLELISEYGQQKIQPYTLMIFPPNTYHKLNLLGNADMYHRIVVAFTVIPELDELIKMKIKKAALVQNDNITKLFMQLLTVFDDKYSTVEKNAFIQSMLAQILMNLNEYDNTCQSEVNAHVNPLIQKTVEYINANINKPITVGEIAKYHMISYSCLTKTFKKEMNISIYKFILSKKLINAHKKILSGENPTQVALDCGFNDYSGFYKQYRKMFHTSPNTSKTSGKWNI